MNSSKLSQEIDFFDFLYEIWRSKWIFLAIILVFTGAPVVLALLRGNVTSVVPETYTATLEIPVVLNPGYDPLERTDITLMMGLVSFVDLDQDTGLTFSDILDKNEKKPPTLLSQETRPYFVRVDEGTWVASIELTVLNYDDTLRKKIDDEFLRASKDMFEETRAMANGAVAIFNAGDAPELFGRSSLLAKSLLFSKMPSVQDGSFRLIVIKPSQVKNIVTSGDSIVTQTGRKSIILWAIIGFVLACIFVMFRIAIRRKAAG